jgi:hypothetical protein
VKQEEVVGMAAVTQIPKPDSAEIRRALALLHEPGEVYEIRALGGRLGRPLSGYFDDHDKAARVALDCARRGAEGVYVTLNPVNRALLARASNKVIEAQRTASTADKDIARRRWLFIDLDAVRPSGISSTDPEHQAALERAREIAAWLSRCNWPSAVLADSGNGAHLLYQVDLPAADNELLRRVLRTLDMVRSDDRVKVDTTTFNPARIVKLYGTPARKGDSMPDRPHRLARLLDVPKDLEHVPKGRLEEIAECIDAQGGPQSHQMNGSNFDVRGRLVRWGIKVLREEPYSDGVRLILNNCPFGEHRKEAKAAVFIDGPGRLGFHCFSDDHAGLGWKELREKYEPGRAIAHHTIHAHNSENAAPAALEAARINRNGTPGAAFEDTTEPGQRDGPKAFPELCIRGTAADWVNTLEPRGEWPRAYLFAEWRMIHSIAIARSAWYGSGKPRYPHCHDLLIGESGITHKNTSIYRAADIIRIMRPKVLVFDNVSSIEGILEQLDEARQSIGIIACGEYSYLVATGKRQGTSNIIPVMNHAYDGVDPLTITKKKAPTVNEPFLNLIAGCTPAWIAEYADKEGADLGRFNRCVVFYADQARDIDDPNHLTRDEQAEFARQFGEKLDAVLRQPAPIVFDVEARERFHEWFLHHRGHLRSLPDNLRKLLEREDDQVRIQATIYAAADGRRVAGIDDVEAAAALIEWSGQNKLQLFGEVEFNTDQRLERRMLAWVDRGGGTLGELYRDLGNLGQAEPVHRKLRSLAAIGRIFLSRAIDQPSREPLRIISPDFRRKESEQ